MSITNGTAAHQPIEPWMSSDPLGKVLDLGRRISVPVAIGLAVFLHAGFAASAARATMFVDVLKWNRMMTQAIHEKLTQEYEVDVEKPPPPPPPPEPEVEKPPPPPPPPKDMPKEETPPEPPAPQVAQAQAVLVAEPKPEDPVDLTGDTIVNGTGDVASGAVSQNGHGTVGSLSKVARTDGATGGTGTAQAAPPPPPSGPDLSRKASPGNVDWNDCGFPPEADAEQIDEQWVVLKVDVGADGHASRIQVVQDPGHGFGRQAKTCAQQKTYQSALDHDGHTIAGQTNDFRVHFIH